MKKVLHVIVVAILTIITQIGGIIYLLSLFVITSSNNQFYKIKRITFFVLLYCVCNLFIVPFLAQFSGREKIEDTKYIKAYSFFYKLANRDYVTTEFNAVLKVVSKEFYKKNNLQIVYLDANFPFINKFPLLPHLSHNDGKKIDLSFIYTNHNFNQKSSENPSLTGYGYFESPFKNEFNQCKYCKSKGFWQYDFTKYLSFSIIPSKNYTFSKNYTKKLVANFVKNKMIKKVFIEPHLKKRLNLTNTKVRFHGCHAVRHDDHIHIEIK